MSGLDEHVPISFSINKLLNMNGSNGTAEGINGANEFTHKPNGVDGSTERTPLLHGEPDRKASKDADEAAISTCRQTAGIVLALIGMVPRSLTCVFVANEDFSYRSLHCGSGPVLLDGHV